MLKKHAREKPPNKMKLDVTGRSGFVLGLVSLVAGLSVYLADPTDSSRSFSSQPATELAEIDSPADSPSDAPADGPAPGGASTPTGGAATKTLGLQIERTPKGPRIEGAKLSGVRAAMNPHLQKGRVARLSRPGAAAWRELIAGDRIILPGFDMEGIEASVMLRTADSGWLRFGGTLDQVNGTFMLSTNFEEIGGLVLFPDLQIAYEIATNAAGEVLMTELPLEAVMCIKYAESVQSGLLAASATTAGVTIAQGASVPSLNTRPGARGVIYVDFDGAEVTEPGWNGGKLISAAKSNFTPDQVGMIIRSVAEDFAPFDLTITTNLADYTAAPVGCRMWVIVTPTTTAAPGSGGVAYLNSWNRAGKSFFSATVPCWVFNSGVKSATDTISHEVGHTFGLYHDGLASGITYYSGHGGDLNTPTSWGPIMGAPFNKSVTQWSNGDYAGANNTEDDLALIARDLNGVGYRPDSVLGTTIGDATRPLSITSGSFDVGGLIRRSDGGDLYEFSTAGGTVSASVRPFSNIYANADLRLELLDASGASLAVSNPAETLNATLSRSVPAGTYRFVVRAASTGPRPASGYSTGFSEYGSLGDYRLSGTVSNAVKTPTNLAPVITRQPVSINVKAGAPASFSVAVSNEAGVSYQWFKNDLPITGGTGKVFAIASAQPASAGTFRVNVSNTGGSTSSAKAVLSVVESVPAPVITQQPVSIVVKPGATASFNVAVSNETGVSYQWLRNGVSISGATGKLFTIVSARVSDAGFYSVSITNPGGTAQSERAALEVITSDTPQTKTIYVSTAGSDVSGTGTAQLPFASIQKGLNAAASGEAVSVSAGTYKTKPLDFGKKAIRLIAEEGSSKTFVDLGREMIATITKPASGEVLIRGFTFMNAYRDNPNDWGASTLLDLGDTSTVVDSCVFRDNAADGTFFTGTSSALLIYASGGDAVVRNCLIYNNRLKSGDNAAAAAIFSGHFKSIENCTVTSNTLDALMTDWWFFIAKSLLRVYHTDTSTIVVNCISWNNRVSLIGARTELYPRKTPVEVPSSSYSIFETVVAGTGNLSKDPLFCNAPAADYSLQKLSPARNSGDPNSIKNADGSRADMGVRVAISGTLAPVITQQPAWLSVKAGAAASFSVAVSNETGVSYQWYRNGAVIAGATGKVFSIPSAQLANAGTYRVNVSNAGGSTPSANAVLTILSAPVITRQPVSLSVKAGAAASFSVAVSNEAGVSYQWYRNGAAITGGTGKVLSIPSAQLANAGTYKVNVSNASGSAPSANAVLTILSAPVITRQPASLSVKAGAAASFSVAVSNETGVSYQWFRNGAVIAGATGKVLSIPSAQLANAGSYNVNVSNAGGSTPSANAVLSIVAVVPAPVITQQPVSLSVKTGAAASFSVAVSNEAGASYQWLRNGVSILGAKGKSFALVSARVTDAGVYLVNVTNPGGTAQSAKATLEVTTTDTPQTKTIYVSAAGSDVSGTGTSQLPFASIQKGLDAAASGEIVSVAGGTYKTKPLDFRKKGIQLIASEGSSKTFVDFGKEMIATITKPAAGEILIQGFTFLNAYRNNPKDWGAAVLLDLGDTSAVVDSCVFRDNAADGTFHSGTSSAFLISTSGGEAVVRNCLIHKNRLKSGDNAAAAAIFSGHFKSIENCTVANNTLDALMTNWGFFIVKSLLRVYHTDATTSVVNCISWNNQISVIGDRKEIYPRKTAIEVPSSSYSISENVVAGTGNLSKDPLFNNAQANDYSLQKLSPARNSGDPNSRNNADGSRADMGVRVMPPVTTPPAPSGFVLVSGGSLPSSSGLGAVSVSTFYIGKTEVTWSEWKAVRAWAVANGYSDLANIGTGDSEKNPVTDANWYDVVKWCNARSQKEGKTPVYTVKGAVYKSGVSLPEVNTLANGYRLPSEREWEFAARGGTQTKGYPYSGSQNLNTVGWYGDNSGNLIHEVATKSANELGISDMSGNVWEWCSTGWQSALDRVIRGGDWATNPGNCTVDNRYSYSPLVRDYSVGFRVVLSSIP